MLAAERQTRILDVLRQRRSARVGELAQELAVSEVTIRRDLETLARENRIAKVHGGATLPAAAGTEEPGFAAKRHLQQREKEAIARAATQFITKGSVIGLSAGTTTWALAHLLRDIPGITVITNSPPIAEVLAPRPTATDESVILTGGVRTPSDALVGPLAVDAIANFNLDVMFLGVHGMHPDTGYSTPNLGEAATNRAFIAAAQRTIVLADHTKWATPGLARIADITAATALITDSALSAAAQRALSEALAPAKGQLITASATSRKET